MSIMNAQLAHLTKMVSGVPRQQEISIQDILVLDFISPIVANCRKLQITDDEIAEAINRGLRKLKKVVAP